MPRLWSRHLVASPPTEQREKLQSDVVARARKNLEKIKAGRKLSEMSVHPRKAASEINLWEGTNSVKDSSESWDSQSDPGSVSSNFRKKFSPRQQQSKKLVSDGEDDNQSDFEQSGRRGQFEGLVKHTEGELRKRNGARKNGEIEEYGDFVVQVPEVVTASVETTSYQNPKYVHAYLDFLYYTFLSSYKWDKAENEDQSKCHYALSIVRKGFSFIYGQPFLITCVAHHDLVIVFYVAFLALFSSFFTIKYEVISFVDERTLSQFIDIGYFMVSCGIHLYFTYFFAFRQVDISKILRVWDEHDKAFPTVIPEKRLGAKWLPIINGLVTIIMAILKTVMYTDIENLSFDGLLLDYSEVVYHGFFAWKPEHLRNSTISDDYVTNINYSSFSLGTLGVLGDFCWHLQIGCFKDLLFWVAVVNQHHVIEFGKRIRNNLLQKKITGKNDPEEDVECWHAYREVLEVNTSTNSTFNKLFLMNHLDAFLVFSYWLTELLNQQVKLRVLIFIGYSVLKGILAYYPARKAAGENDICGDWIRSLPCDTKRFHVGETPFTRDIMLVEQEKKPLGIGKAKVHVNNEFLVSFITLVASLFCFLLNLKPKNEEETRY